MADASVPERESRAWVTQFGAAPILRWYPWRGRPWLIEGGIGLNTISPAYRNGRKRFGSEFNFGDHFGVGARFDRRGTREMALRVEHYSSGGIEEPNPGEEFLQLRFVRRF